MSLEVTNTLQPPKTLYRLNYKPPVYLINEVKLDFFLDHRQTRVASKLYFTKLAVETEEDLMLDGENLTLISLTLDGKEVPYQVLEQGIHIKRQYLPATFVLDIVNLCSPINNTALSGLYLSERALITQCEAKGFRRITYYQDRPDVMARFQVRIQANKSMFPVLLSNGNLLEQGDLSNGEHFALWEDPHKKPSYLFALVAGDYACRQRKIVSKQGREHFLQIYVKAADLSKTEHAMNSLVASIQWDETRFNLSLDLDRFMIVAVSDFNAGAMENKGLNIFNAAYILADPTTATDVDYANIESVVAHEYFHNWTGNRVTCRDWFQLSLKEGLTVFRDQEFSQDLAGNDSARSVLRIEDVRALRTIQFSEDAGPMAHPVRPDSVAEIDNFYTATIYEKGAEVIRMMQTIVGKAGFAKGLALYFQRHDGQAVTCDDFLAAIADANPHSVLSTEREIFSRWYAQAGTPRLKMTSHFDFEQMTYTLTFQQSNDPAHQQNLPFLIPIKFGLIGHKDDSAVTEKFDGLLCLGTAQNSCEIKGLTQEPVPSFLREFSAPILLEYEYSPEQLLLLLQKDSDPFNRWEASQRIYIQTFKQHYPQALAACQNNTALELTPFHSDVMMAIQSLLDNPTLDPAFKDLLFTLPSERYLLEAIPLADPKAVALLRKSMLKQFSNQLVTFWEKTYNSCDTSSLPFQPGFPQRGLRSLANLSLFYLCYSKQGDWAHKTLNIFKNASNMTVRQGALSALLHSSHSLATEALNLWYQWYDSNALLLDKWFAFQALAPDQNGSTLQSVKTLLTRPDFSLRNPNRARSVLFNFCMNNPAAFHDKKGYEFWYDQVISLDTINPQLAARFARVMDKWASWPEPYCSEAKLVLNRFQSMVLSPVLKEIIFKSTSVGS